MSVIASKPSKATTMARVQAFIAGTQKHFPNESFKLGNTAYTTTTLIQALQSLEHALVALNAAHASVRDAGTALRGIQANVGPLMRDYKRYVLATFSTATQELADFGLPPLKARKPLNSDQRAAAKAKMKATRAARGTTSRKKKLAIKGDVTGVLVTPITDAGSSSPAPSAAPAETPSTTHAPTSASK
jgi:hypothetical protein